MGKHLLRACGSPPNCPVCFGGVLVNSLIDSYLHELAASIDCESVKSPY
jgi:hypothetical protein